MLSPVNQTVIPSPQIPLALLRQSPGDDWLYAETDDLEVQLPAAAVQDVPRAEISLDFLRQMAADDRLREDLERDPAVALARHGIQVDPETFPEKVELPSAEALRTALRFHCGEEAEAIFVRHMGYLGLGD